MSASSSDAFNSADRLAGEALARWATGSAREAAGRVIVADSAAQLDQARRLAGSAPSSVVFAPAEPDTSIAGSVITYDGSLSTVGEEALVGGRELVCVQDYLGTAFAPVVGQTFVRMTRAEDYRIFLADADLALQAGVFVEQLLHPAVWLTDLCALGTQHPCGGLARAHVDAQGRVRTAPGGVPLGTNLSAVDDLVEAARFDEDVCLAVATIAEARLERPWLSRYLWAIEAQRTLHDAEYRVSGFGGRLTREADPSPVEAADAPILLWAENHAVLYHPHIGRSFRLGLDAGRLVELLLVSGSAEDALPLAVASLSLDVDTARRALREVAEWFDTAQAALLTGAGV